MTDNVATALWSGHGLVFVGTRNGTLYVGVTNDLARRVASLGYPGDLEVEELRDLIDDRDRTVSALIIERLGRLPRPQDRVRIGEYAFVHGVWFISDASIEVGDHSMRIVRSDNTVKRACPQTNCMVGSATGSG